MGKLLPIKFDTHTKTIVLTHSHITCLKFGCCDGISVLNSHFSFLRPLELVLMDHNSMFIVWSFICLDLFFFKPQRFSANFSFFQYIRTSP